MQDFGQFIPLILIITIVVVVVKLKNKGRQTRIDEFNKKHGTNFKNELDLNYFIATKLDKKLDSKMSSGRKVEAVIKEDDLGESLKRLKKMHNDGHLSKVEFEKAKNKLLK